MTPETTAKMNEIVKAAREGREIIPAFFQPGRYASNTVSAAIRAAIKRGFIEQSGVDGIGKPKYRATVPGKTHAGPTTIN